MAVQCPACRSMTTAMFCDCGQDLRALVKGEAAAAPKVLHEDRNAKTCPNCERFREPSAGVCACGFNFVQWSMPQKKSSSSSSTYDAPYATSAQNIHRDHDTLQLVATVFGVIMVMVGIGVAVAGKPVLGIALVVGAAVRFMIRTAN